MLWPAAPIGVSGGGEGPAAAAAAGGAPLVRASARDSAEPTGVGVLGLLAATVAVNVTGWPKTVGLPEEASVVVVPAWVIVCVSADAVALLAKLALPL